MRIRNAMMCWLLLCLPALASAKGFYLGDWSDEELIEHVQGLVAKAEADSQSAAALCLNHSLLFEAKSESYRKTLNREFLLLDEAAERVADQRYVVGLQAKIKDVAGWVLRTDGTLERLEEDDIVRVDGDDTKLGEVKLSYPNLDVGDALGYSLVMESKQPLSSETIPIALPYPTVGGSVVVQTSGQHAYVLTARNMQKTNIELDKRDKKKGAYRVILANFNHIPAHQEFSFGEPYVKSAAHINILNTYDMAEYKGEWAWFSVGNWNHQASIGLALGNWYGEDKAVKSKAKELMKGVSQEVLTERLFAFVRDEIRTVDRSEFTLGLASSPKEILEVQEASANEKSLLLFGLMKAAKQAPDIAYIRSYFMGKAVNRQPTLLNFFDIAVRDARGRWFWPGDASIPPGELPPWMRQSEYLVPYADVFDRFERASREAMKDNPGSLVRYYKVYEAQVQGQEWYEMSKTDGDPFAVYSDITTELDVDPLEESTSVKMVLRRNEADSKLRREGDNDAVVRDQVFAVLQSQLQGMEIERDDIEVVSARSVKTRSTVECSIPANEIPLPTGDVWLLPMDQLIAGREFEDWEGEDRGPMFVNVTRQRTLVVSVPLPEGWAGVKDIAPFSLQNPRIDYFVEYGIEDGRLTIRRRCRLKAGTTEVEQIPDMDKDIARIAAYEATPLAVEKF